MKKSRYEFGPLKRLPKEKPFLVWDIETKPAYLGEPLNTIFLGAGLYAGVGDPEIYTDETAFFKRLCSTEFFDHWIYAHNASGFDDHYLLRFLRKHKIKWDAIRIGGRIFIKALDRDFLDSAAILSGSLASIGDKLNLNVKKHKVDKDFYTDIENREWRPYLADDLRSLFEAIQIMRESFGKLGGVLRSTIASTAMCLFRSQYLDCSFRGFGPYDSDPELFRQAYFGGRVECFKPKMGEGHSWDINSSYPTSMIHPDGIPCDYLGVTGCSSIPTEPALCQATITIPIDERHPPLVTRAKDRRLYFVTGKRSGLFTSAELQYCFDKYGSSSVQITRAHLFKPRPLFDSYIKSLYVLKGKAGPLGFSAKLAMNSLYGKTAQDRQRERVVTGEEWIDWPWDNPNALKMFERLNKKPTKTILDRDDFVFCIEERAQFAPYILPQIAATITARSRLLLQKLLDKAGPRSVYCDTDSIYAEAPSDFFPTSKALGGLKLESKISHGLFPAPKVYYIVEADGTAKGKAKGVSYRDANDVLRFINGEAVRVKRMLGVFESMKRHKGPDPVSEWQDKSARVFSQRRHPEGRPFSIDELVTMGALEKPQTRKG